MKVPTDSLRVDHPKPIPPLSQSRHGDMACQTLYVHKHVRRLRGAESAPAARGIEIHQVLATYISHLVKTRRTTDLEVFDAYRLSTQEDQKKMDKARADCRRRIDTQLGVLTTKRRDVKLLEHLKERRFEKWEKDMFKEIDQRADEAYLAKFGKR